MKKKFNKYICDLEGCKHRNEENICCLFNQENCVYFRKVMDLKSENLALDRAYTELHKQYEKMKCCSNCKYYQFPPSYCYKTCTKEGKLQGADYRSCKFNLEFWEMKEDD